MRRAIQDPVTRSVVTQLESELDQLRAIVNARSVKPTVFGQVVYIGSFAGPSKASLPDPISDPNVIRLARLNRQGEGYGDEFYMDGKLGNGNKAWIRVSGFPDS